MLSKFSFSTQKIHNVSNINKFIPGCLITLMCVAFPLAVSSLGNETTISNSDNIIKTTTLHSSTGQMLQDAGIWVGDKNKSTVTTSSDDSVGSDVKSVFTVHLQTKNSFDSFPVHNGTVRDLLKSAGLPSDENFAVSPSIDTPLTPNLRVFILPHHNITLRMQGYERSVWVPHVSVSKALEIVGITLQNGQTLSISGDTPTTDGLIIEISDVHERVYSLYTTIPFARINKRVDSLPAGSSNVVQTGSNGEKELLIKEVYRNGELVEKMTISEKVIVPTIDTITHIASESKPVPKPKPTIGSSCKNVAVIDNSNNKTLVDTHGNVISYKKLLVGQCTAYCDKGLTASGRTAKYGNVAVNPRVIPYGTRLYIVSPDGSIVYGHAVAADTGGALMSGRVLVDLHYDSEAKCNRFGRRNMRVYVLA